LTKTRPVATGVVVRVYFRGRRVTDSTLDLLAALPEIREPGLRDTRVTDAGIRRIGGLTKLERLFLDGVAITDQGLSSPISCKELEAVSLCDTRIEGRNLAALKPLCRLRCLAVEGSLATVDGLGSLNGLTSLWLLKTELTEGRFYPLRRLRGLEELHLGDETVTHDSLAAIQRLPKLRVLFAGAVGGAETVREVLLQANPNVRIVTPFCGSGAMSRAGGLEARQLRRQGPTGRLRLASRSIVAGIW
jgi:hypothetical protein